MACSSVLEIKTFLLPQDGESATEFVISKTKSHPLPVGNAPRVLFFVPGHQAGHDGITDQTFWIVAAAARAGVDCMVFAAFPFDDAGEDYSARVPPTVPGKLTIKIATAGTASSRLAQLEAACLEFNPDWISVQFTPGTFREGRFFLPGLLNLIRILRRQNARVALTAHESFRVLVSDGSWRDRSLGWLRRLEIEFGLKRLKTAKFFVSNSQHCADFSRIGHTPTILPIMSNIPRALPSAACPDSEVPVGATVALLFGRISVDWDPSPVLSALAHEAAKSSQTLVVVSVGEIGHRGRGWQNVTKAATAIGLPAFQLGALSSAAISVWIQRASYGISSTPLPVWQKSSTCAAMIDHELSLIFSEDTTADTPFLPPCFAIVQDGTLKWYDAPAERHIRHPSPDEVWSRMELT
jgi:hypothetical protein